MNVGLVFDFDKFKSANNIKVKNDSFPNKLFAMKRTPFFVSLLIASTLLFSSCHTNLYTPNEAYMLSVSSPGDVKVAGAHLRNSDARRLGFNHKFRQSQVQLAISPIKHLGLVGSHFRQFNEDFDGPTNSYRKHTELGLGYYHVSGKNKETDRSYVVQDFYTGGGWGKYYELFYTAGEMYSNYQRFFLHYGIHLWWKNDVSIGFGIRYARTNFGEVNLIGNVPSGAETGLAEVQDRDPLNVLEGSIQIQTGSNYAKLFFSTTGVLRSQVVDFSGNYRFGGPTATVGITVDLDEIWKAGITKVKN